MKMNRLKSYRVKNNLTQAELGKRIGVSDQYISDVENSKYPISDKIALKCAVYFGVTVDEIRGEVEV